MVRSNEPSDDRLLRHSRALGDPTRNAVFAHLRDADGPCSVAELTEHFGLNHNAIRHHLARLLEAGLVVEQVDAPSGPGRPPKRYRTAPGAAERWGGESPHEALSTMLLDVLRGDGTPREVGRSMGRRLSAEYGDVSSSVEVLAAAARRLGFEPEEEPTGRGVDVVLHRCPFAEQAAASPDVVCGLHHGIAEGLAERAVDGATVEGLVVHPPEEAGCRIEVVLAGKLAAGPSERP
jgi:predicted ArsR family transcriptional regulator